MRDEFPKSLTSLAVVLRGENIDTDVITPVSRIIQGPEQFTRFAFEALRFDNQGQLLDTDPFSDPDRENAQILIAGKNFGCGSSRETAAIAIRRMGFRVVIASSFGDIFYSNCLKNGVLAVRLKPSDVARMMDGADVLTALTVDLESQSVECCEDKFPFQINPLAKKLLLSGKDEIAVMDDYLDAHECFLRNDERRRPWLAHRII